jgi:integrase
MLGRPLSDLPRWFDQLSSLKNPLRREFHLFLLLSGSRPEAIKRARVLDLDLRARVLHVPRPKGGADRAFDIPLSLEMIRCIIRALRFGELQYPGSARTNIFPADSAPGHIVEHKEKRSDLSKWGNDLRQTYRTVGQIAGVSELDMHLLMNHSLPGVNTGYLTRHRLTGDHLRKQQQMISSTIVAAFWMDLYARKRAQNWVMLPAAIAVRLQARSRA